MKRFKRITAFFLAAVMILAMDSTAFATERTDLPEPPGKRPANMEEHGFTAYQIFKGEAENGALIGIDWGKNIKPVEFLDDLKKSSAFEVNGKNLFSDITYESGATYKSADAVANIIQSWPGDTSAATKETIDTKAREFARLADEHKTGKGKVKGETLDAGYYLIVDTTTVAGVDTAKNLSVLEIALGGQSFAAENKTDVPEIEKKVKEVNDSTGKSGWQDAADYDIGDDVEFVLTGTLPADYYSYKTTYKYVFHDTLSTGLLLDTNSIKVYINKNEVEGYTTEFENIDGESLRVTFDNLKEYPEVDENSVIQVVYKAKLTDEAVIGKPGNNNRVYLEYSNDPNATGDGEGTTGRTPEKTVVVFTYQSVVHKKDENNNDLSGAAFTLYKYYATEPATIETDEKGIQIIVPDADKYEVVSEIDSGDGIYEFKFEGIDAGSYKLVETKVPDNYNKVEDLYFEVKSVLGEQGLTSLTVPTIYYNRNPEGERIELIPVEDQDVFTFTPNLDDGSLSADIVNKHGFLFPATGGIGTTIFYVIGGILIVGAGVLLIVKKRADKSE